MVVELYIYPHMELLPINSRLSSQTFFPVNILISPSCLVLLRSNIVQLQFSLSFCVSLTQPTVPTRVGLIAFNSLQFHFWTEITHLLYYIILYCLASHSFVVYISKPTQTHFLFKHPKSLREITYSHDREKKS